MHHEPSPGKLVTKRGAMLLALMLAGAVSFVVRFALGLGATTNLSDNYPWGLWIVFDLVWIALAAGAFVTAGLVYIFRSEKFHALARPAVWMGLLSYSFVVVTLLADLGLPWRAWNLAVQRPRHSAMFEVSWCVTLYVTVLGAEFAPALFERFGWSRLRDLWRTWSPVYTVVAVGWFVYLMSHSVTMAIGALAVFGLVAYATRKSVQGLGVPVILVIAAVTFSVMHQSSLGSLFLLMPDKLSPLWWSPIMPLLFLVSAIVSGLAAVVLMSMLINRSFGRASDMEMLASMGKMILGVLAAYVALRVGDLAFHGKLGLIAGPKGGLLLVEILGGGFAPIVLLSTGSLRRRPRVLVSAALLALLGVVLHRTNVVLLGMNLPGTVPGGPVGLYLPSVVEWVLSVSLVAAAVFFFAVGAKLLPILPGSGDRARGHQSGKGEGKPLDGGSLVSSSNQPLSSAAE